LQAYITAGTLCRRLAISAQYQAHRDNNGYATNRFSG